MASAQVPPVRSIYRLADVEWWRCLLLLSSRGVVVARCRHRVVSSFRHAVLSSRGVVVTRCSRFVTWCRRCSVPRVVTRCRRCWVPPQNNVDAVQFLASRVAAKFWCCINGCRDTWRKQDNKAASVFADSRSVVGLSTCSILYTILFAFNSWIALRTSGSDSVPPRDDINLISQSAVA